MPCLDLDPRPATTLHPCIRHLSPLSSLPPLDISPSLHPSIPPSLSLSPSQPPTLALSLSPLSLLPPALLGPGQRLLGNPRARHAATFSFMFAGPAQSHLCTHPGRYQPGSERRRYCNTLEGPVAGLGAITEGESCTHPTEWALHTDCGSHCGQTEAAGTLGGHWDMLGLVLEYPGTSILLIT